MFTKVTLTYVRMSVLCEDHTGGTSSRGERRENEASVMDLWNFASLQDYSNAAGLPACGYVQTGGR